MKNIISIVLAAGRGTRLGGAKALLLWPFANAGAPIQPFTQRKQDKEARSELPLAIAHARTRLGAESERVLIVIRSPMFRALLPYVSPGIELISSSAPDELGAAGSIAAAVQNLGQAKAAFIVPVDTPPTSPKTTQKLLAALDADTADPPQLLAVRPRCSGRPGHPILLRAQALNPYKNQASPPILRDHLRALGTACADIDTDDPLVLRNLNTPEDFMSLWAKKPRFLSIS